MAQVGDGVKKIIGLTLEKVYAVIRYRARWHFFFHLITRKQV